MSDATSSVSAGKLSDAIEAMDAIALDRLFRRARTHNIWSDRVVEEVTLHRLYELMKMAPTSMNMCPARFVFIRSAKAKERLRPALVRGNVEKTMTAPVCAIIGYDLAAWEHLPRLFPQKDMSEMFRDNTAFAEETSFRNGSLQGAYFIIAARAVGLDCGPMSGFDNDAVDASFFLGTKIRSNFLCNLGYGMPDKLWRRAPRFDFDEVCEIL